MYESLMEELRNEATQYATAEEVLQFSEHETVALISHYIHRIPKLPKHTDVSKLFPLLTEGDVPLISSASISAYQDMFSSGGARTALNHHSSLPTSMMNRMLLTMLLMHVVSVHQLKQPF